MPPELLTVKFFIPNPRQSLTDRTDLLERFNLGLARSLTLISAPAGFGKSTLLCDWLARQSADSVSGAKSDIYCWLSLDALDSQVARYWTYLVASIQIGVQRCQLGEFAGSSLNVDQILEYLQNDPSPIIPTILDALINLISSCSEKVFLILDDYQHIKSPEIHEQMAYLLEHQPPNLHLIISTRTDPPLPITRLRAKGQLSEFRVADLRFTLSEVEEFFRKFHGLPIVGEDAEAIHSSTEGWIAGLQMAGLALQGMLTEYSSLDIEQRQRRIREFVGSFSGRNLYVLDYLTDEVFKHLSVELQTFLLKTSILERLSAELCEAVLQNDEEESKSMPPGISTSSSNAISTLEFLEKSNLFVIGLDHERQWFRYHHLFADHLRARLRQTWPAIIPNLNQNASHWYAKNGFVDDAIQHALRASDWPWAARLMETHVTKYLELGQLATVLKWIDSLPFEILEIHPVLCAQVAEALAHAGQFQRVPQLLDMIESSIKNFDERKVGDETLIPTKKDFIRVRGIVILLRAFGCIVTGKAEQAVHLGKNALDSIPEFEPREKAWINWVCGYAYRAIGQLNEAIDAYERALEFGRIAKTMTEDMATDLGIAYRLSGKLTQAAEVFQNVLRETESIGMLNKGSLSRVETFYSAVLLDMNRLEEALEHAKKAIFYLQWWPSHNHVTTAYSFLCQVLLGMGRLDEAAEAIQKAQREKLKGQVMPTVLGLVDYISIRLWLQLGYWDLLEQWLSTRLTDLPEINNDARMFKENVDVPLVSLARVLIAKGRKEANTSRFETVMQVLSQLEISAKRSHWAHALIEIHLLQAITLYEMGINGVSKTKKAMDYLTASLELGLPAGYLRIYLQEGLVVADMLQIWLKSSFSSQNKGDLKPEMVTNLLHLFRLDQRVETSKANENLIEPLTEREQEVLKLLARGLSNKEMAEHMVVSEGTVKTHIHNLIGKLAATSRTHALARAKELNLL